MPALVDLVGELARSQHKHPKRVPQPSRMARDRFAQSALRRAAGLAARLAVWPSEHRVAQGAPVCLGWQARCRLRHGAGRPKQTCRVEGDATSIGSTHPRGVTPTREPFYSDAHPATIAASGASGKEAVNSGAKTA